MKSVLIFNRPHLSFFTCINISITFYLINDFIRIFYPDSLRYSYLFISITIPLLFFFFFPLKLKQKNTSIFILLFTLVPIFIFISSIYQQRSLFYTLKLLPKVTNNAILSILIIKGYLSPKYIKILLGFQIITFSYLTLINYDFLHNTFSLYLVFYTSLYYITLFEYNRPSKYPYWPAFFSFIIALGMHGRSGIIASAFLFLGVIINNLVRKKDFLRIFILMISIALVLLLLIPEHFEKSKKRLFEKSISDDPRIEMMISYLSNLKEAGSLLWGYDKTKISFLEPWNYNMHNSFFQAHYIMGIAGVILIFFILFGVIKKSLNSSLFFLFIGSALLFRIFTDTAAFIGDMDFVLYYFLYKNTKT